MEFEHHCAFCGWSRIADTAIVAPAGCPQCGCAVDSAARGYGVGGRAEEEPARRAAATVPTRILVVTFSFALAAAAARLGYDIAAVPGAITAVGVAGYLLLPFVPERLGEVG